MSMFNWKSRRTPVPTTPASATDRKPVEPQVCPDGSLLGTQVRILGRDSALTIVDAGAQDGQTTEEYLKAFPCCRVIALEPESANYAAAAIRLAPFADRVELIRAGLSDSNGAADLHLTSHSGAHSLLEVGDMRHYDEPVAILAPERIETVTLDRLCAARNIDVLDILKMDIQGGELMALNGAGGMLARGAIRLIALEALFQPLYRSQPTFWDLQQHLQRFGYAFQGLYDVKHHNANPAVLRWADAIFVAPGMTAI
jgi:FkbM family methyltransferase